MTKVMNLLGMYLDMRGHLSLRLDGQTVDRGNLVDTWNDPNSRYFVFMLSTKAGGIGINLQTADTVILFDSEWFVISPPFLSHPQSLTFHSPKPPPIFPGTRNSTSKPWLVSIVSARRKKC